MRPLVGTWVLSRLALRRDRLMIPIWLTAVFGLIVAAISSLLALYPTEEERTETAVNRAALPVLRAIKGNPAGDSPGALAMHEMYMYVAVMVALMSIFIVVRHTRQNEETSRSEMIASGVVGRYAPLAAAMLVACVANLGTVAVIVLALVLNGAPLTGSIAAGVGVAGVGLTFAGVAAVTTQLSETARGANGLALMVAGVAYLLRTVGDAIGSVEPGDTQVGSAWPSWLSPLGWGQLISAFHGERWWILGLFVVWVVVLLAVALVLTERRDVGMSLFPARPGPARASSGLLRVFGLTRRLQGGVLLAWVIALAMTGTLFGLIGADADQLAAQDEQIANLLTTLGGPDADSREVFFAATISVLGVVVAGYALQALLRMRSEELGPLESVLATSVSRQRWMLSHTLSAMGGVVALLAVVGLTAGLTAGLATGELAARLPEVTAIALAEIPAVLAFSGFVVLAFGLLPRFASAIAWAGLAVATAMAGLAGAIVLTDGEFQLPFGLSPLVLNVSPFTHTSTIAANMTTTTNAVTLVCVAAALTAAGTVMFRQRDLAL